MGLSSSKSTATTKPIYAPQIEGAAGSVASARDTAMPKITAITDTLGSFVPGLAEQYTKGDPNVTAARAYNADVLSGKYLNSNPFLQPMIDQTLNDSRNQTTAALGTRGLVGGSAMMDIVSRNAANAANTLRYNDYNTQMGRMDSAAAAAPALSSAQYLPLSIMQSLAETQQLPVQTAAGAGSAIGGLLGQYTNQTQKQSNSIGSLLSGVLGSALSGWASGGFKGI